MKRLIFATGNKGKMREIREIMEGCGLEILSMKEAGVDPEIVEDGTTFEENAYLKASAIAIFSPPLTILIEDSPSGP